MHGHKDVEEYDGAHIPSGWDEGKDYLRCKRCHTVVPADNPERFKETDCDQLYEVLHG